MKTPPLELLIDPDHTATVTTHARYAGSRFTTQATRQFPTREYAGRWCHQQIQDGARWLHPQCVPTVDLPDLKAWRTGDLLTVAVNGAVVAETDSPRVIRGALSVFPELQSASCAVCGGLPVVNLREGTVTHGRIVRGKWKPAEGCNKVIRIEDERVPMAVKIHAWNTYFADRKAALQLCPVTIPHLLEIGVLREPTEEEMVGRLRRVEVL